MKITLKKLEEKLIKAASKFVTPEEAKYFATEQIECTLRMYPDVNPIEEAVQELEVWKNNPNKSLKIITEKPGSLLIDFNGLAPSLKLKYLHDKLEVRAKNNGIATIGLNNSSVTVWLKLLTNALAKRGLIGIYVFNGGGESVVPYGGSVPVFGTNPISYAIPTNDEPILVDMASSESAFFRYSKARKNKTLMKENTFADINGNPTNDPEKAYINDDNCRILPMGGGYRGYNIVFLIEVLTGALVRSKMGLEKTSAYTPCEYGGLLMAIDISSLTDLTKFKNSVSEMCQSIRNQKPGNHVDKVIAPGDISLDNAKKLLKVGSLEIDDSLIKKLDQLQ